MKADLHVHSCASDGTETPDSLVRMALEAELAVLAITDHDSVEGVASALVAAAEQDLILIPAVELSAGVGRWDLHMLGYFVDHTDPALLKELARMRDSRLERATRMVQALQAAGYDVDVDDVLRHSDGGAVGRSHVARALVERGTAETVRDAFERLIGHGRPFYVPKGPVTPSKAIALIHSAGGMAVLAHPGVNQLPDELIVSLKAVGLDGVEAYHADHTQEQREHYAAFAARHSLLTTGGTDYHGPGGPNPALGTVVVPEEATRALLGTRH